MFSRRILVFVSFVLCLAGCAGGDKAPNAATQNAVVDNSDVVNFVADKTPMPDSNPWIDAANHEDAAAQFIMQMMYLDRIGDVAHMEAGAHVDDALDDSAMKKEMMRWRKYASDQNFVYAVLASNPSLFFEASGDQDEENVLSYEKSEDVRNWLEEAAKRGYGNSEYILGLIYWNGLGVTADKKKGFDLILRAADHGVVQAQYMIGMIYELGLERPVNRDKSMKWLNKAADAESSDAMFILAMKYADGIGVAKDLDKSAEIEKKNLKYHVWAMLHRDYSGKFDRVCSFRFDEGIIKNYFEDECGDGDGEYYPEVEDMTEEESLKFYENLELNHLAEYSLRYSIDYATARKWMQEAAKDTNHDHARMLLSQIYASSGCRGGVSVYEDGRLNPARDKEVTDMLQSAIDHQYPGAIFALGSYYHNNSDEESADARYRQALSLYEEAAKEGDKNACKVLGDVYRGIDSPSLSEALGIESDDKKAFEYHKMAGDVSAAYEAANVAEEHLNAGDDALAVEWYQKAIDLYMQDANSDKDSYETKEWSLAMASIYRKKNSPIYDLDKAMELYHKVLDGDGYKYVYPNALRKAALELGDIYKSGAGKIKKNKKLALEWYKRAIEAFGDAWVDCRDKHNKCDVSSAVSYFNAQPKADLIDAVENQIKLEKGRKPTEFFVVKSAYLPCKNNHYRCPDNTANLLKESVEKAVTGITAWSLAKNGKVDLDYIDNTFYELAVLFGESYNYRRKLSGYSPAYGAFAKDYDLMHKDNITLFYIWYLRQIPYAAADEFKKLESAKSWDDYMKEAKKAVDSNEKLKTGFGYDLFNNIQSFKDGLKP